MKLTKYNIITTCIFSVLFISSHTLIREPFELYLPYVFVIILLPFFISKFPFPLRETLFILLPLLFFGLLSIKTGDNAYPFFLKIWINFFVFILFFHYVFVMYNYDTELLFSYYMKGAYIVSFLGLFQVICFKLGLNYLASFGHIFNKWGLQPGGALGIRMNSVFSEPTYFATYISPAFFVSLNNLFRNKQLFINRNKSILIFGTFFLTFSSIGYIGVLVSIVVFLIYLGFVRYVIIALPILFFTYNYIYENVPDFRERVDGMDDLVNERAETGFQVHGSSYILYDNWVVAKENMKRNPLWGTGLGSHQVAFPKYSTAKEFRVDNILTGNYQDASSMFLRLMSETGLFGIGVMLWLLIGSFVKRAEDDSNEVYWVICGATFIVIFLQLFRMGNYTFSGFFFYLYLYYYNSRKNKEFMSNEQLTIISEQ